ncbi:MAG: NAD(P)H-dependent oxidoreductase [Lachnospiraceae bacterium]|nr:NAD(P)H-dependent oxidoreductase [Lachnospiraceae bacterium]
MLLLDKGDLNTMPTLLLINACVRGKDSRTLQLCERLLESIKEENKKDLAFHIEEIRLSTENLLPLNYERLQRRDELLANGLFSDTMFDYANAVAQADMLVIAAPYWDMSFPSTLKIFFEAASVVGITFAYAEDGTPVGLCQAQDMYYVTTSGGYIGECNFGFEYVNALCKLYGIERSHFVSAQGLDMEGADVEAIMAQATMEDF